MIETKTDDVEAEKLVEKIQMHLKELGSRWIGHPLKLEEVMANAVFWGSILTRFFPEALPAAQLMIERTEVKAALDTVPADGDKSKWN